MAVLFVDALQRMVRIAQEGEVPFFLNGLEVFFSKQLSLAGATAKMKQDMADARTETN